MVDDAGSAGQFLEARKLGGLVQDELVGVVNLTNPALAGGVFTEEDVERVRLLALVIALVATSARLPERLVETLSVY